MSMRASHSAGGSEGDTGTLLQRLRRFSGRAWWLHAVLIAQMILLPCPQPARGVWIEVDTDGDGIVDSGYDDGTPEPTEDPSEPWIPDPVYDSDGDGLDDANESAFGTDPYNPDSDYDGLSDADEVHLSGTNPLLPDSNDNGISDYNEYYGNYTVDTGGGTTPYDWDGDGIEDPVDPDPWSPENQPDSDGDYVPDNEDSHPYESWLWSDWNGNGVNDDAESPESDSDGDGISDSTDSHPWDVSLYNDWNGNGENDENEDWDGDGVGNLQDSHPNSNSLWCDWNGNGVNDDSEAGLMDQDGDGYNDSEDSHPFNAALYNDWNGDGIDDHNQTPPDPTQGPTDSDNDGYADDSDSHPWDSLLWNDWNGNSVNDDQENWSSDSDADGYADISDTHPNDSSLWSDYNQNGINDEYELPSETPEEPEPIPEEPPYDIYSDTDADGITDFHDTHPSDSSRWNDYDDNGINDDQEILLMDRDGDGYADHVDSHPDDMELWNDHNGDGINDQHQAPPDSDNDGIPDHLDEFPEDYDNDGLSDVEELLWGTDYALADTEGDGLNDGEEVYAGTDPLNVDTDGDGLSDLEELRTHFTNPLEPTTLMVDEPPPPPEYEEGLPTEGEEPMGNDMPTPEEEPGDPTPPVLKVDWLQGGTEGSIQLVSGTYLSFPGSRVYTSTSDPLYGSEFNRSIVIKNTGGTPFTDLVLTCVGADSNRFATSSVTNSLAPGASATFTVSLTSPSVDKAATLEISATELSSPFLIHLVSVGGIWTHNAADGTGMRRHLFANLTDTDKDGIPDKVEQLYAPLVVTPDGDLDGDGISNLTQYFNGRSLTSSGSNTDYDGDGLSNTEEDAWARAYPGSLSKFSFADAYADPDGDGLMTIEELDGTWGGAKDPHAVATHPFVKSSAPPVTTTSTGVTAGTYRTSSRKPPPQSTLASHSAHISRRSTQYAAWFDDGMLRKASHEAAAANKGKVPSDFYNRVHITSPPTPPSPLRVADVGTDHLPNGYVQWLTQSFGGMLPPGFPTPITTDQVSPLRLGRSSDMDSDALPDVWEAFYQRASKAACPITWRDPGDSTPELARIALTLRTTALQERISANALRLQDAGITSTTSNALTLENVRLEAEIAAISQVYGSLNPEGSNWESLAHTPAAGSSVTVKLVPVYSLKAPKFPAALAATPATTLASRRSTWITKHAEALYWQALQKLDPDHDGLSNSDERLLGHNPNLTDFTPTAGQRDTDEDGFSDEIELAVGSNHLNASYKPKFAVVVHAETADLNASCMQPLSKAIPIQTVLTGPGGGLWPLGNQSLSATATDNFTLLAWQREGEPIDWNPKTVSAINTDESGRAWLHVNPSWKKGSLRVTLLGVPSYSSATLTASTATCELTIVAPVGDTDADGMPDVWETKAAQGGQPAHALNKLSPLDAEPGPLHFGYHPATPLDKLPATVKAEIEGVILQGRVLKYYPVVYQAGGGISHAQWTMLSIVDPDRDGISNLDEMRSGTNPRLANHAFTIGADTDGDGFTDAEEFLAGSDAFSANSKPALNLRLIAGGYQNGNPNESFPGAVVVEARRGIRLSESPLQVQVNGGFAMVRQHGGDEWLSSIVSLPDSSGRITFEVKAGGIAGAFDVRVSNDSENAVLQVPFGIVAGTESTAGQNSEGLPELGENDLFYPASGNIAFYASYASSSAGAHWIPHVIANQDGGFDLNELKYYSRCVEVSEIKDSYQRNVFTQVGESTHDAQESVRYTKIVTREHGYKKPLFVFNLDDHGDIMEHGQFYSTSNRDEILEVDGRILDRSMHASPSFPLLSQTTYRGVWFDKANDDSPRQTYGFGFRQSEWNDWENGEVVQKSSSGDYWPRPTGTPFFDWQSNVTYSDNGFKIQTFGVVDQSQFPNYSGTSDSSLETEYSGEITPADVYAGAVSGMSAADWSEWQRVASTEIAASSSTPIEAGRMAANINFSSYRMRYELPEGASPAEFEQKTVHLLITRTIPGVNGASTNEFEIQSVTLEPGQESEVFVCDASDVPGSSKTVGLLPVEINSRDRAVEGFIPNIDPSKPMKLGFSSGSKSYGTYEIPQSGSSNDVHVYNSVDDIFSDSEAEQYKNGSLSPKAWQQQVVLVREGTGVRFYTVADNLSEFKVTLYSGNQQIGEVKHQLTEDKDFGRVIAAANGFIKGDAPPRITGWSSFPTGTTQEPPDIPALTDAALDNLLATAPPNVASNYSAASTTQATNSTAENPAAGIAANWQTERYQFAGFVLAAHEAATETEWAAFSAALLAVGYDPAPLLNNNAAPAADTPLAGAAAAGGIYSNPPPGQSRNGLTMPAEISNRGLVSKALMWIINKTVLTQAAVGEGVIFGMWDGIKGDVEGVVNLLTLQPLRDFIQFVKDPYRAAGELYKIFRYLKDNGWEGVKAAATSMLQEFMGQQQARLECLLGAPDVEDPTYLNAYLAGYAVGFIGEQVVVAVFTAGVGKVGWIAKAFEMGSGAATKVLQLAGNIGSQMHKASKGFFGDVARVGRSADEIRATRRSASLCGSVTGCLAAGTLVLLADGSYLPIENIRHDHLVMSDDPYDNAPPYPARVRSQIETRNTTVLDISYSESSTLTCTVEHPFYVANRGWVMATDLRRGDQFICPDARSFTVNSVTERNGEFTTYNLDVDGPDSFFVTATVEVPPVLTHNLEGEECIYGLLPASGARGTSRVYVRDASNTTAVPAFKRNKVTGVLEPWYLSNPQHHFYFDAGIKAVFTDAPLVFVHDLQKVPINTAFPGIELNWEQHVVAHIYGDNWLSANGYKPANQMNRDDWVRLYSEGKWNEVAEEMVRGANTKGANITPDKINRLKNASAGRLAEFNRLKNCAGL